MSGPYLRCDRCRDEYEAKPRLLRPLFDLCPSCSADLDAWVAAGVPDVSVAIELPKGGNS